MRESPVRASSIRPVSLANARHHAHFAGFAAVRTVIQPVHAQPYAVLPLADAAVALALTIRPRLIADCANHLRHAASTFNLYDESRATTRRTAGAGASRSEPLRPTLAS